MQRFFFFNALIYLTTVTPNEKQPSEKPFNPAVDPRRSRGVSNAVCSDAGAGGRRRRFDEVVTQGGCLCPGLTFRLREIHFVHANVS